MEKTKEELEALEAAPMSEKAVSSPVDEQEVPDYVRAKGLVEERRAYIRTLLKERPKTTNRGVIDAVKVKFGVAVAPETVAKIRAQEGVKGLPEEQKERSEFVKELLRQHDGRISNVAIVEAVKDKFGGERIWSETVTKIREGLGYKSRDDLYEERTKYLHARLLETNGEIRNIDLAREVKEKLGVGTSTHTFTHLRKELGVMDAVEARNMAMRKPEKRKTSHKAAPDVSAVGKQVAIPAAKIPVMSDDRMENGLYRTIGDLMSRKGYRVIRFEMNGAKLEVLKEELRETKTSIALRDE